ncbi:MAG: polysaccharide pyruvyl transferase family protein [Thiohalomonadaceae bacterium]
MDKQNRVYQVGISGSYGGLNLGDEAILQGIVTQLRDSLPVEITVFSRDPADTLRRHDVEHAIPVRRLGRNDILPYIRNLDLLIIGGGGILFDAEARIYLREAVLAQEVGVPFVIYAVGVGPLEHSSVREIVRSTLDKAALITVREQGARHLLEDIGVQRTIEVTSDPALLLEPEPLPPGALKQEGLEGRRRRVALSVREPGVAAPDLSSHAYHALLASAADYMVDRLEAEVVFVPMERRMHDLQQAHAVVSQMLLAQKATVLKGEYSAGQLLSLLGQFDLAVGMRLHFLLFAALQNVPFVALPYAPKVSGFLEQLGVAMPPPLGQVNAGRLIAHIDHAWDHRRRLQQQLIERLPVMQEAARATNRMVVELLGATVPAGD